MIFLSDITRNLNNTVVMTVVHQGCDMIRCPRALSPRYMSSVPLNDRWHSRLCSYNDEIPGLYWPDKTVTASWENRKRLYLPDRCLMSVCCAASSHYPDSTEGTGWQQESAGMVGAGELVDGSEEATICLSAPGWIKHDMQWNRMGKKDKEWQDIFTDAMLIMKFTVLFVVGNVESLPCSHNQQLLSPLTYGAAEIKFIPSFMFFYWVIYCYW